MRVIKLIAKTKDLYRPIITIKVHRKYKSDSNRFYSVKVERSGYRTGFSSDILAHYSRCKRTDVAKVIADARAMFGCEFIRWN